MTDQHMQTLASLFESVSRHTETFDVWVSARQEVRAQGATAVPGALARVARAPDRELFLSLDHPQRIHRVGEIVVDLAALRTIDMAGVLLLVETLQHGATATLLRERFDEGDLDERVMALRALPWAGDGPIVQELLGEAQRANALDLFEAGACDTNLAALRLDEGDFNRMVLRMAFLDLPLWRMLEATSRANTDLSRTLLDFAREREAAGRPVWVDTLRLIARAPAPGAEVRLLGSLEHGRTDMRLAAAESLPHLSNPHHIAYLEERLSVEMRADVQAALRRALQQLESASPEGQR